MIVLEIGDHRPRVLSSDEPVDLDRPIQALDLPLTPVLEGEAAPIGETDGHRGGEDLRRAGGGDGSMSPVPYRLGFAVKVLGAPEPIKEADRRRWQSGPHLRHSIEMLHRVWDHLERIDVRMYRMSSNVIPYGSHPDLPQFDYRRQIAECAEALDALGDRTPGRRRLRGAQSSLIWITFPIRHGVRMPARVALSRYAALEMATEVAAPAPGAVAGCPWPVALSRSQRTRSARLGPMRAHQFQTAATHGHATRSASPLAPLPGNLDVAAPTMRLCGDGPLPSPSTLRSP